VVWNLRRRDLVGDIRYFRSSVGWFPGAEDSIVVPGAGAPPLSRGLLDAIKLTCKR